MVSCSTFVTELECALHYQNEFNVKLILLLTLLGFIAFSIWYSRESKFSEAESYGEMLKHISFSIFPRVLLTFYPFFLFTLMSVVSLELIINSVIVIYFILLALSVGLFLYLGKDFIASILGDRRDNKFKYMNKR